MSGNTLKVLRDRNASLYLGAVLVSGFGDSAMLLAGGIWVKTLTGSNSLAALVSFCMWLPTFAGPVIGTVADRVKRRPLLIAANFALAVIMTAPLAVHSRGDVWLLFPVLTLIGTGMVLAQAAETALMAAAVPDELRGYFNGLVRSAIESMKLIAPLAGAGLFSLWGGRAVALLDAVTFVAAAAAFRLIRVQEAQPKARPKRKWTADTAEGARYLWGHPVLRSLVLVGLTVMVLSGLSNTATFAMLDGVHRSPSFAGVLVSIQGFGSIAGGLAAGGLMRKLPARRFASAGLALFAVGVLLRATPWLPVVLGGTLILGVGVPWPVITAMTAVQRETPTELLGRVAATSNTLMYAPTGLALLLGTGMVAVLDYRVQIVAAGVVGLAVAASVVLTGRATRATAPVSAPPLPGTASEV